MFVINKNAICLIKRDEAPIKRTSLGYNPGTMFDGCNIFLTQPLHDLIFLDVCFVSNDTKMPVYARLCCLITLQYVFKF